MLTKDQKNSRLDISKYPLHKLCKNNARFFVVVFFSFCPGVLKQALTKVFGLFHPVSKFSLYIMYILFISFVTKQKGVYIIKIERQRLVSVSFSFIS